MFFINWEHAGLHFIFMKIYIKTILFFNFHIFRGIYYYRDIFMESKTYCIGTYTK